MCRNSVSGILEAATIGMQLGLAHLRSAGGSGYKDSVPNEITHKML